MTTIIEPIQKTQEEEYKRILEENKKKQEKENILWDIAYHTGQYLNMWDEDNKTLDIRTCMQIKHYVAEKYPKSKSSEEYNFYCSGLMNRRLKWRKHIEEMIDNFGKEYIELCNANDKKYKTFGEYLESPEVITSWAKSTTGVFD